MIEKNKFMVPFTAAVLFIALAVLSGCSGMRKIEFTKIPSRQAGTNENTLDIRNFKFEIVPKNPYKTTFPNGKEILRKRFMEHLAAGNITPVSTGEGKYVLWGTLTIHETNSVNGWLAATIAVSLIGWGLGTPLGLLFPCVTYYHSADATLILFDAETGKELMRSNVSEGPHKTWHMVYQLGTSPESKRNVLIEQVADEVMKKAADELGSFMQRGGQAPLKN